MTLGVHVARMAEDKKSMQNFSETAYLADVGRIFKCSSGKERFRCELMFSGLGLEQPKNSFEQGNFFGP
jgi:hypothetical protein